MSAVDRKSPVVERISFSLAEVADAHGIHIKTLRRMIERGELRVIRFGASIRIPKSEIERLGGG
jgi:excisionase family DNA binding protein